VSALEPVVENKKILLSENVWENELQGWPENILSELRKNPKYADCFA
jgi:hypothetical protein